MRLFVSVEPSAAARAGLAQRIDGLDLTPARLIPAERWHITLAFLGEVADSVLPDLQEELGLAAQAARPLTLRLAGAGRFPAGGRPSVLWVGLAGDVEPLRRLAREVGRAVRRAGVRLQRRPFAAHLTVGRYRDAPPGAADAAVAALSAYTGPGFAVEELRLMRSHLGPHPRHEQVDASRLADLP